MPIKTYVLLPNMDADAPIYQQTADKQRIQVKKIPFHRPTLRQTFQDERGIGKTIRYKEGSATIDQKEQIEKEKIDANEPFTRVERSDLMFRYGVLVTKKEMAQTYLESHPEFQGFKGFCDDVREPRYKLLDNEAEARLKNSDTKLRVKAAYKVMNMESLEDLQSLMLRLNGSFFVPPNNVDDCQNDLMNFIDDAEEEGLKAVLKEEKDTTVDDQTKVLIGKLINAELLTFDAVKGNISKKDKDGKWMPIRELSDEYPIDTRVKMFSDFLNTEDGKVLRLDLERDLKKGKK